MRLSFSTLLAMALMPGLAAQDVRAQDAVVYVVSYVEVAPAAYASYAFWSRHTVTTAN